MSRPTAIAPPSSRRLQLSRGRRPDGPSALLLATAGLLACLMLGGVLAAPAAAQSAPDDLDEGTWAVKSFMAVIDVAVDGRLEVTEDVVVDFGDAERHGISRVLPVRYPLAPGTPVDLPADRDRDEYLRRIEISDVRVTSSAPDDLRIERPSPARGSALRLHIGDRDTTVTGRQRYRIHYEVAGALTRREDLVELHWNVTGNSWPVPIAKAQVLVRGPQPGHHTCLRGLEGATSLCDELSAVPEATRYTAFDLRPGEAMTIVFPYGPGVVDAPPPSLVERPSLARAFTGSPLTVPITALTTILALGAVALLLYRQVRDRLRRGGVGVDSRVEPLGEPWLRRPLTVPLQYRAPGELRPAQLGLVVDELVEPVQVTATVVDLAVRGYLVITEDDGATADQALWAARTDWIISRRPAPADELLRYEQQLLDALFREGDEVRVSDLRARSASDYRRVRDLIYRDGGEYGWFANRPDRRGDRWVGVGLFTTLLSGGLLAAAALQSTIALAFVPFVVAALVLLLAHRAMPHRTVRGSEVLRRTLGFRGFIATAETGRVEYAEEAQLFVSYLPYAVLFGAVDRWARAFADLDGDGTVAAESWYASAGSAGELTMHTLASGVSDFSAAVSANLPLVPPDRGDQRRRRHGPGHAGATA